MRRARSNFDEAENILVRKFRWISMATVLVVKSTRTMMWRRSIKIDCGKVLHDPDGAVSVMVQSIAK